jgi:hypothetical protein
MSTVLGRFEGYSLRAIEDADYEQLQKWIAADPAHAAEMVPEFFMGLAADETGQLAVDPRPSVFALCDRNGTLMYIRLTRASRVHIQFPPTPETSDSRELHKHRRQITNALIKGMAYLEVGLERAGATEWIFETESPQLRAMVQKRMGFAPSPHEMLRMIPRQGLLPGTAAAYPTDEEEG